MKKRKCEKCGHKKGFTRCGRNARTNPYTDVTEGLNDRSMNKDGKCRLYIHWWRFWRLK